MSECSKHDLPIVSGMWERFSKTMYPFHAHCSTIDSTYKGNDPHYHDHCQLFYCISGSYTFKLKNESFRCHEGSLVIIPPATIHDYIIDEGNTCTIIFINLMLNFFDDPTSKKQLSAVTHLFLSSFSSEIGYSPLLHVPLCDKIKRTADRLFGSLAKKDWSKNISTFSELRNEFCEFFSSEFFSLPESLCTSAKKFLTNKYIPLIKTVYYMNINYNKQIHSSELVAMSYLCQTDYFRYIKRIVGCTYSTYLQMLRVRHAVILCSFTNYTFSYISDICGFCNLSYMENRMRKFKCSVPGNMQKKRIQLIKVWPGMIKSRNEYEKISPHFYAFGLK